VVIFPNGQNLTSEAQAALLKTLEEPPAGSRLIITVDQATSVLPTVRSRAQAVAVLPPSKADLIKHFASEGFDEAAIERTYSLSGGLPALMHALLSDSEHPLLAAVEVARELLQATMFERLARIDELGKQKQLCRDTLFILQQMASIGLKKADSKAAQRWQAVLTAAYQTETALATSAQPKLALTHLMLNF
ncbi:MAG TPA: hypothetical protein VG992_04605, partial [Candidatus Saccharimonadales bacterium]|nr:hypothetical protein [Candidatus Saccharimonadales bacterium]